MSHNTENSTPLWTAADVYDAIEIADIGLWQAKGVSIDSRTLNPDDIYVALKGKNHDGHKFVEDAIDKGAVKAIVETIPDYVPPEKCIVVEDSLHALRQLGLVRRENVTANIVGVTGSVGKTSVKEMPGAAMGGQKRTHVSKKSHNNHLGVPLTLANMPKDSEIGIFEMGMNNAGEISQLTRQVRPDVSIITTVQNVHLENLGTPDNIAKAKSEIMEGMSRGSSIILNKDNRYYDFMRNIAKERGIWPFSFGMDMHADSHINDIVVSSTRTYVEASILDEVYGIEFEFIGKHHAVNALAVLTAAKLLEMDMERAVYDLENWTPGAGRGEVEFVQIKPNQPPVTVLNESYNCSPVALKAALDVLRHTQPSGGKGRRITILGDMSELGSKRAYIHAEQVIPVENAGVDLVYTCGPLMKNLYENLLEEMKGGHFNAPEELAPHISRIIRPGDVVLVKGSRGGGEEPKMEVIVKAIRALSGKKEFQVEEDEAFIDAV